MKKRTPVLSFMEVCGTHTMAIARHGLRKLLPPGVRLLSGPGCPICVTESSGIDRAILTSRDPRVITATFGDMLHVPGSSSSLEIERSRGTDVRVVYSPMDALSIAADNPTREVVFVGVGFETTTPTIAATVIAAQKRRIGNFSVIPLFKTVPNALRFILEQGRSVGAPPIDGFLLPGHVSAIIGTRPYEFIAREFGVPGVVAGFEPGDILKSVALLQKMAVSGRPAIEIQYTRAVAPDGNPTALSLLSNVFRVADAGWRAIGPIPASGLAFNTEYAAFDATRRFPLTPPKACEPRGCQCGAILLGAKRPVQCRLFGKACTPAHPVGPCMVSSEGACAAEYKYGDISETLRRL
jgi:hydrogenase expression/formation protein HypD